MGATIKDIAAAVGVSRGTVDRVLHNRGGVNPEVSSRVLKVADELGFAPNRAGRLLATLKQPLRIAALLPDIGNVFFDDVKKGLYSALDSLSSYGISLDFFHVKGYEESAHLKKLEEIGKASFDALILASPNTERITALVDSFAIPVVTLNLDLPLNNRLFYIGPDYRKGGEVVAGLLMKMSRKKEKVLIFTGSRNLFGHNERIKGFMSRLDEMHFPYFVLSVSEVLDDDEIAYEKARKEFENHPDTTVVFVTAAGINGVSKALKEVKFEQKPFFLPSMLYLPL
jgi:Transcriptional regulators